MGGFGSSSGMHLGRPDGSNHSIGTSSNNTLRTQNTAQSSNMLPSVGEGRDSFPTSVASSRLTGTGVPMGQSFLLQQHLQLQQQAEVVMTEEGAGTGERSSWDHWQEQRLQQLLWQQRDKDSGPLVPVSPQWRAAGTDPNIYAVVTGVAAVGIGEPRRRSTAMVAMTKSGDFSTGQLKPRPRGPPAKTKSLSNVTSRWVHAKCVLTMRLLANIQRSTDMTISL